MLSPIAINFTYEHSIHANSLSHASSQSAYYHSFLNITHTTKGAPYVPPPRVRPLLLGSCPRHHLASLWDHSTWLAAVLHAPPTRTCHRCRLVFPRRHTPHHRPHVWGATEEGQPRLRRGLAAGDFLAFILHLPAQPSRAPIYFLLSAHHIYCLARLRLRLQPHPSRPPRPWGSAPANPRHRDGRRLTAPVASSRRHRLGGDWRRSPAPCQVGVPRCTLSRWHTAKPYPLDPRPPVGGLRLPNPHGPFPSACSLSSRDWASRCVPASADYAHDFPPRPLLPPSQPGSTTLLPGQNSSCCADWPAAPTSPNSGSRLCS